MTKQTIKNISNHHLHQLIRLCSGYYLHYLFFFQKGIEALSQNVTAAFAGFYSISNFLGPPFAADSRNSLFGGGFRRSISIFV
jgi:hypothetical protein